MTVAGDGETLDAIGEGRVRLLQRRDGYRFNLDSVLLAGFAIDELEAERACKVVDLGTGCGVVPAKTTSRKIRRRRGAEAATNPQA